ncbi:hypothetical protein F8M41_001365 [Gigaspora margarita]|uniref:Uncharacterized protein n=1 Tax=Gigaspora margarita TaxID=4874 RepID=A0A8H3XF95_GIGMA|nr:hypothetical protein F8M41_001365 [Gigaspora margarita]
MDRNTLGAYNGVKDSAEQALDDSADSDPNRKGKEYQRSGYKQTTSTSQYVDFFINNEQPTPAAFFEHLKEGRMTQNFLFVGDIVDQIDFRTTSKDDVHKICGNNMPKKITTELAFSRNHIALEYFSNDTKFSIRGRHC